MSPHAASHHSRRIHGQVTIDADVQTLPRKSTNEADSKQQHKLRGWWDEAIKAKMDLSDGYLGAAVLLIKWDDPIDQTKSAAEVEQLREVFENGYNYSVEIANLKAATKATPNTPQVPKPQHQLSEIMSRFVANHDGPGKLLVVYYTGHGMWVPHEEELRLSPTDDPQQRARLGSSAWATWDQAEQHLRGKYVEADVFAILDTCFSSNLHKGDMEEGSVRAYQLLSACGIDQTTTNNKDRSFTQALIVTLKAMLVEYKEKSFTPHILSEHINLRESRRHEPSLVWNRLHNHSLPISLAPLDKEKSRRHFIEPAKGHLTLRFALKHASLGKEEMRSLAHKLSKCFGKESSVKGIAYVGFRELNRTNEFQRTATAYRVLQKWRDVIKKRRETGTLKRVPTPSPKQAHGTKADAQPPTRKRGRADESHALGSPPPVPGKPAKIRTRLTSSPTRDRKDDNDDTPLTPRTMTPPPPA